MLSIDGFECAGHPGEDDIGGLLLVRFPVAQFFLPSSSPLFSIFLVTFPSSSSASARDSEDTLTYISSLVQLALAAKKLKTPYIASGGIADGRGLAAAIALGAEGVNCGTVFMATEESYVHQNIKDEMVKADERSTTHIFRSLRNTARVFKNDIAKEVVAKERRAGGVEFAEIQPVRRRFLFFLSLPPFLSFLLNSSPLATPPPSPTLRRRTCFTRHSASFFLLDRRSDLFLLPSSQLVSGARGKGVYDFGDPNAGVWSASGVMGLIDDVPSCATLLKRMEKDAEKILTEGATKVIAEGARSKL
jgi:NAD(P)H-dependent flavin oxidoreductase YrpB (nitropropane dioxygenase family)